MINYCRTVSEPYLLDLQRPLSDPVPPVNWRVLVSEFVAVLNIETV